LFAARTHRTISRIGIVFVAIFALARAQTSDTIEQFKKLYGNSRDYKEFRVINLNQNKYLLAFWYQDNSPLQLSVDVFRYEDRELQKPIRKFYTGDVSEEISEIADLDLTGDGRAELIFLCASGQIKIIRVFEERRDSLVLRFEKGGSDISVVRSTREIWIKSRTAKELDVYRWDPRIRRFVKAKTLQIVF
jgi:hypothetical protein